MICHTCLRCGFSLFLLSLQTFKPNANPIFFTGKSLSMTRFDTNSPKKIKDTDLIASALAGNQSAFSQLLMRHKEPVYQTLFKMINNETVAEDLMLETFVKAFQNLDSYSSKYAFRTWLHKIATNNCIDYMRKRKGLQILIDDYDEVGADSLLTQKISSEDPNPEESLIHQQNSKWMQDIIKKLKPHYQLLVEYRYFNDMSYEEISSKLNLPMGTVKTQLFRLREMLFRLIEADGGE